MALEDEIADYFAAQGFQWKLKTGQMITPDADDVIKVLDKAAATLYDGSTGDLLVVGRLLIIKQDNGFDVYVLAGTYK